MSEVSKADKYPQLIPFNSEAARAAQRKSTEQKWCQRAVAENYKLNARTFIKIMADLPDLGPLEIMKLAIHDALDKSDFEAAAKYASMLAEYQMPKLARIESTVTTRTSDLSDEELKAIIDKEGL
jgi:hypothetical protein